MTVEMEQPFAWPEEPKDFSPWDKQTYEAAQKDRESLQDTLRPDYAQQPTKERASIAEQAQALLQGKEKWRPSSSFTSLRTSVWEDVGEPVEVETHVSVTRPTDHRS